MKILLILIRCFSSESMTVASESKLIVLHEEKRNIIFDQICVIHVCHLYPIIYVQLFDDFNIYDIYNQFAVISRYVNVIIAKQNAYIK